MELSAALEMVARSDPGMVRSNNEDSVMTNASPDFCSANAAPVRG